MPRDYNLEIIGEAAKHLPDDFKAKYAKVEWRKIAGLLNWAKMASRASFASCPTRPNFSSIVLLPVAGEYQSESFSA